MNINGRTIGCGWSVPLRAIAFPFNPPESPMPELKTGAIRPHDRTKFVDQSTGMGGQGICSMKLRGPHEPPVIDFYEARRNRNGTGGRWLALCRHHAHRRNVTDEQIDAVCWSDQEWRQSLADDLTGRIAPQPTIEIGDAMTELTDQHLGEDATVTISLRTALDLWMVSDGCDIHDDEEFFQALDAASRDAGFGGAVEAYHQCGPGVLTSADRRTSRRIGTPACGR